MKNAPFNPDDYFETITVEDLAIKFPQLKESDYKTISLSSKLIELNYEIISKEYIDKQFSNLEDYYTIEVDPIV